MSEYPLNYLDDRITTFGAIKQDLEIVLGVLDNTRHEFNPEIVSEVETLVSHALNRWKSLRLPTKERMSHG